MIESAIHNRMCFTQNLNKYNYRLEPNLNANANC